MSLDLNEFFRWPWGSRSVSWEPVTRNHRIRCLIHDHHEKSHVTDGSFGLKHPRGHCSFFMWFTRHISHIAIKIRQLCKSWNQAIVWGLSLGSECVSTCWKSFQVGQQPERQSHKAWLPTRQWNIEDNRLRSMINQTRQTRQDKLVLLCVCVCVSSHKVAHLCVFSHKTTSIMQNCCHFHSFRT